MVEVRLYATLRNCVSGCGSDGILLDVAEGGRVNDVMSQLGIDPEDVKLIMVNGQSNTLKHVLADGDRLGLFPPIGGG